MTKNILLVSVLTIEIIASDFSLLHPQKQEIRKEKLNEIEALHKKQKYDWVAPLSLSLSKNKSKSLTSGTYTVDQATVGLNQDIFRSGGIYYTMAFADKQRNYQLLTWEKENNELYQQIYTTVVTLKRLNFQLKQSEYRLKNTEIDLFLKQEQYKVGSVDMTQLNNAIMDKNDQLKQIITIKESVVSTQKKLKELTPFSLEEIDTPIFTMIDKDKYIQQNYAINQADIQSDVNFNQYKNTKSNYLPHVSINAEVGYQEYNQKTYNTDYDGNFYSTGLSISMPLDFNSNTTIEEQRAAYLQAKLQIEDEKLLGMVGFGWRMMREVLELREVQ